MHPLVLVVLGGLVVAGAFFGARLTREQLVGDGPGPDAATPDQPDVLDPLDPWAAFTPRPIEDVERKRARLWPILVGATGLVVLAAGLAAAQRSSRPVATPLATPKPTLIEVKIASASKPAPTPKATPAPTPVVTRAPTATASPSTPPPTPGPTAPPSVTGPAITGQASCAEGSLKVNFTVTAPQGTTLSYYSLYLDGEVVGGGAISDQTFSSGFERTATPGDHEFEVVAQSRDGGEAVKRFSTACA